jgi:endonuclease/exonuclease/phosphatase family metal-dependent hydrolase
MGDFNCTAESPEMALLYQRTRLQPPDCPVPTFPAWRPQRAIDHILVSSDLGHGEMQAQPAARSDHLALSVQLEVPVLALA